MQRARLTLVVLAALVSTWLVAAAEGPYEPPVLSRELRATLAATIAVCTSPEDGDPLLLPLLALARLGEEQNPWAILVYQKTLENSDQPWVRRYALHRLASHQAVVDILNMGGTPLAKTLIGLAEGPSEGEGRIATAILARLQAAHGEPIEIVDGDWHVRASYPAGYSLTTPPNDSAPHKKRGTTGVQTTEHLWPQLFGSERTDHRLDVVWTLDVSGSMQKKLPGAIADVDYISSMVKRLLGNVHFGALAYRDHVEGRLAIGDEELALSTMPNLVGKAGGSPDERVDLAFRGVMGKKMGWRTDSRKAVVFLGDAGPKQKHETALFGAVRSARKKHPGLRVHAVDYGRLAPRNPLLEGIPRREESFWTRLTNVGEGRTVRIFSIRVVELLCQDMVTKASAAQLREILTVVQAVEGDLPSRRPRQPRDRSARATALGR